MDPKLYLLDVGVPHFRLTLVLLVIASFGINS